MKLLKNKILRIATLLTVLFLGASLSPQAQIVIAQQLNFDIGFISMLSAFHASDETKNTSNQLQIIETKPAISKSNISDIKNNDKSQFIIVDNEIYKICPNDKNTPIKIYPKCDLTNKINTCKSSSKNNKLQ